MDRCNRQTCKLVSFNCKSVKRSVEAVKFLCQSADILALQETWLLPHDIPYLGQIHDDFEYIGKSAVDLTAGIFRGRPYGGVAILWRKRVFKSVTVIDCVSPRLSAIKVSLENKFIIVFSVYMPTDSSENLLEFTECLSEISAIVEASNIETVYVLGDFNAHPDELFCNELLNFCSEQEWLCADIEKLGLGSNSYTFVSDAHGCERLDHCVVTQSAWLTVTDIKAIIPPEIEVAYHNGPNSCIISGPADHMKTFIIELIAKEISVEKMPSHDIAYHSSYITEAEKWLSTSILRALSRDHHAKMSSADYHTNSFLSPVIFEESARLIPDNAIIIEIGPHGLLQEILNGLFKNNAIHVPLVDRIHANNVQFLLTALGKLYEAGLNAHLANIYPTVKFPVSQGTPMLAHLVEWDHNENWFMTSFKKLNQMSVQERRVKISVNSEESDFLLGHVVDGRQLYPATGYLVMVWETFGMMMGQFFTELSVIFEDVRFQRATNIPKNGDLDFIVVIHKGSGLFEIVESDALIVTGRIKFKNNVGQDYRWLPAEPESTGPNVKHLLTKDFYKELRLRGYQYSGLFRGVLGCNVEGTRGRLAWVNEWVTFLDCMLQMKIISQDTRGLFVPTRIEKLSIDVNMHYDAVSKMNLKFMKHSFEVRVYPHVDVIRASGVEIRGLHATPIPKRIPLGVPVLEKNIFVSNFGKSTMKIEDILRSNIQLILENVQTYKVKSIEIVDDEYITNGIEPIMDKVADILDDLPLIQTDLQVLSKDAIKMPSNINIENKKLGGETNVLLLIGANLLNRDEVLNEALLSLRDKGFIISRELEPINMKDYSDKYDIIGIQKTGFEFVVLFRKRTGIKSTNFVKIITTDDTYAWIDKVKEGLEGGKKLVIYSQDEEINGLLGFVNCLRREPSGENVHGLLIADPTAPPFNPDLEFYAKQLDMDLAINVYQDGQWGTYRHLLLGDLETIRAHHAYVKTVTVGDLSSQQWLEGPIKEDQLLRNPNNVLINVYCSALNFRDIMYATGRVTVDALARGRLAQECVQGLEVVGRTKK
ncbi:unnamed protein product [Euphydryas editha]|uniref:PKS/mFAS DH domain-containing protein n=1 Tax=Euphydryas editha TaxID=104508 RepID=A0AAU9U5V2_EUPED|nr:unnamed protein product [Euphydryas editha]